MHSSRTLSKLLLLSSAVLLSGCINQTSIQSNYEANRDACQTSAEQNIGRFMEPGEESNMRIRNAKLVTLFSDCMFEHGWTVATPEHEDEEKLAGKKDDLPQLNDVRAGAAAKQPAQTAPAAAPAAPPAPAAAQAPQSAPALDNGRRAPAQQNAP